VKYPPSFPVLMEALKAKFPDASVTAGLKPILQENTVVERKSHIIIDWS
jgi:hypothetical protein